MGSFILLQCQDDFFLVLKRLWVEFSRGTASRRSTRKVCQSKKVQAAGLFTQRLRARRYYGGRRCYSRASLRRLARAVRAPSVLKLKSAQL